jgi:ribosomal protein S12 methylthiotransferase accessory factor YcaO
VGATGGPAAGHDGDRQVTSSVSPQRNVDAPAQIAPWVVRAAAHDQHLLVGPRLTVLSIPAGVRAADLLAAGHHDFVSGVSQSSPGPPRAVPAGCPADADLCLIDETRYGYGPALAQSLRLLGVRAHVRGRNPGHDCPQMLLADTEPDPLAWKTKWKVPILWSGECHDGTFVGPLISNQAELDEYAEATCTYFGDRALRDLGVTTRPLPLLTDPLRVQTTAAAIVRLLAGCRRGEVILVDDQRPVCLWTSVRYRKVPADRAENEQAWSLGFVRDLAVEQVAGIHLASCRSPAGRVPAELEGNSGKARVVADAKIRAISESAERVAAWLANAALPAAVAQPAERLPLEFFHPYGPIWDANPHRSHRQVEYVRGESLTHEREVLVPKALVTFPYEPGPGFERPTWGVTSGLACHPEPAEAIIRALREVLERDCLYPNFLHQRPATRLVHEAVDAAVCGLLDASPTMSLTVLRYDCTVPIAHAFAVTQSAAGPMLGRGCGSGLSWREAIERAVEEAIQVHTEALRARQLHMGSAFREWRRPEVAARVLGYLSAQPPGNCPPWLESASAAEQLTDVVADLRAAGSEVVLVRLPCPIEGWHAVRVLVRGATTSQWASDSEGGRKLRLAPWQFGIPG